MPSDPKKISEFSGKVFGALDTIRGLKFRQFLGKGAYGIVAKFWDPIRESNLAAKIVKVVLPGETTHWPRLSHANIVPVLDIIPIPNTATVYTMPILPADLYHRIYEQEFRQDPKSWMRIKKYLADVLHGLKYLQSMGLCHLDLKEQNVLICQHDRAKICDFSTALPSHLATSKNKIGLPRMCRPPEAVIGDAPLQGEYVDSWAFGIMALEIVTHHALSTRIVGPFNWERHVNKFIKKIRKLNAFIVFVKISFPNITFETSEMKLLLNFINGFLEDVPSNRFSPVLALQHDFLVQIPQVIRYQSQPVFFDNGETSSKKLSDIESINVLRASGEVTRKFTPVKSNSFKEFNVRHKSKSKSELDLSRVNGAKADLQQSAIKINKETFVKTNKPTVDTIKEFSDLKKTDAPKKFSNMETRRELDSSVNRNDFKREDKSRTLKEKDERILEELTNAKAVQTPDNNWEKNKEAKDSNESLNEVHNDKKENYDSKKGKKTSKRNHGICHGLFRNYRLRLGKMFNGLKRKKGKK